jgi:hypothetical protein
MTTAGPSPQLKAGSSESRSAEQRSSLPSDSPRTVPTVVQPHVNLSRGLRLAGNEQVITM